jgi:hypothetical protein
VVARAAVAVEVANPGQGAFQERYG